MRGTPSSRQVTAACTLAPLTLEDAFALALATAGEPATSAGVPRPWGPDDGAAWFSRVAVAAARGEAYVFAVRAGGHPTAGAVRLSRFSPDRHCAQLSYLIAPVCRRCGLATAAVKHVLALGVRQLGLTTIQTVVAADNAASRGVLHRAGFTALGALGGDTPGALLGYQWRFANHGE